LELDTNKCLRSLTIDCVMYSKELNMDAHEKLNKNTARKIIITNGFVFLTKMLLSIDFSKK